MKKLSCIFFAIFSLLASVQGFAQDEDGFPLPFLEQWNSGTFGTNNWITDGPNWSVNGNEGNPDPCAEFTWDPIQTDYSIALESYPLLADSLTEGSIYLDFDLKLDNFSPTGTEQMLVQVWNWNSQEWSTVSTYSNIDGSFSWMSEHLDISSQALGTVFKIRFLASGENSLNILGWFVDNIHLYRACMPPLELTVEPNGQLEGFELNWERPEVPWIDEWIEWDDGVNSGNSIGTGTAVEFDVAARWEPSQLEDFAGASITEIAFVPAEEQAIYKLRVWVGYNANLVYEQLIENPVINQWNYVTLATPLTIDINQELWIGYYVNTTTGYPAGVDDGPAIEGFGNMMNFGGWQTLLQINPEFDFNWNIKAHIETVDRKKTKSDNSILKYAVYRNDDQTGYFLLDYTYEETYLDDSEPCGNTNYICYEVTALYFSNIDSCESEPSNESCYLCWPFIAENSGLNIAIYPNPASDALFIESEEKIESVRIFDSRGEKVIRWEGDKGKRGQGDGETWRINLGELAPGIYLVQVDLGDEIISRKIIVQH